MCAVLIRNATIVTMDDEGTVLDRSDLLVRGGLIAEVGSGLRAGSEVEQTDATGRWLLPGFVQPHVHLCQTLFRGLAEDLELLEWLRERIWPMEAALDPESLRSGVRMGIHELVSSGTTAVLDMGTVHHEEVIFEEAERLGIRLHGGKAMMEAGEGVPDGLAEEGGASLRGSVDLARKFHGQAGGRLRYVFCPRFLLSVGPELLRETAAEARRMGCRMQTHASESKDEARAVERATGLSSMRFLEKAGFLGPDISLVHAVHLSDKEISLIERTSTHVVHCPGSNAKLGSGTARVPRMLEMGLNVAIAADGAACNNNLSAFGEMRLAGHLQSLRLGPGSLPAEAIVRMATRGGAACLGLGDEIGSIERGKRADLVLVNPRMSHSAAPFSDLYTRIVYQMDGRNVEGVWVDGQRLYEGGQVRGLDEEEVVAGAQLQLRKLLNVLM